MRQLSPDSSLDSSFSPLNIARIESSMSISFSNTRTQSKRSSAKSLSSDSTETFNFRQSFSSMMEELSPIQPTRHRQIFCTPESKKDRLSDLVTCGKTFTIKGKKGLLYKQICPICLGEFSETKGVLGCQHEFCSDCIETWAATSSDCPCCRRNFPQIINKGPNGATKVIEVPERKAEFLQADYYICYNCQRGDDEHVLLICDSCDFYCCHIYCDPVLQSSIPEGDWYCKYCEERMRARSINNQEALELSVSSISESDSALGVSQERSGEKPIAARTRSRGAEPVTRMLHRMRRRG